MVTPGSSSQKISISQPQSSSEPLRLAAVVEIGTTAIRLAIAEGNDQSDFRILETLTKSLAIGNDTYSLGYLTHDTIESCIQVLQEYQDKLLEYQLTDLNDIRVVATSAVREAENTLAFIDRVYVATGWAVDVLDVAEMHRVIYQGLMSSRSNLPNLGTEQWVVAEVGGGNTEILVLNHGQIHSSLALRVGSLRLRSTHKLHQTPESMLVEIMKGELSRSYQDLFAQIDPKRPVRLLALGGEMRLAASEILNQDVSENFLTITQSDLDTYTNSILDVSVDEIVQQHHLPIPDAETLGPALLANAELARHFRVNEICVTSVSLRKGLLRELFDRDLWSDELVHQIILSAIDVGRKFHFDEAHAKHVARLCKILFNQLNPLHSLNRRYELLLTLAALLHEIGLFIGTSSYHKHSMYLINNSELFGLGQKQVMLVGLIARYHRRASPKPTHTMFASLSRQDRVAVAKLAAILRVAIALDSSRSQRIHDFESSIQKKRLLISLSEVSDISMEQMALRSGRKLFQEIFGIPILLRSERTQDQIRNLDQLRDQMI